MSPRSLALLSYKPGVGKSTSAVFLAFALHQRGHRVCLVDADPGGSAQRWNDEAARHFEKFPFDVLGVPERNLYSKLRARTIGDQWDWVIIDCPQLEDHAEIGRAAMRFADDWVLPMAPSGIEFDRALRTRILMDEVQEALVAEGMTYRRNRYALLNRCNRRNPSKRGPDQQFRKILTDLGFHVFRAQVENSDDRYRQVFGVGPVEAGRTPYAEIAAQLEAGRLEAPQ